MKIQVLVFTVAMATGVLLVRASADDVSKDPDVQFVNNLHNAVIVGQSLAPPYHYSYGYEVYNATTEITYGQYESRYGDVAVGTYYRISPNDERKTIEYAVDSTNGFQASVRKDVPSRPVMRQGFSRLAAPYAFVFRPATSDLPMNLVETALAEASSPQAEYAFGIHKSVIEHHQLRAPFNFTWGYEVRKSKKGHDRSHYESYVGEEGEGRLVFLKDDGILMGIKTKVNATGFYGNTPDIPAQEKLRADRGKASLNYEYKHTLR